MKFKICLIVLIVISLVKITVDAKGENELLLALVSCVGIIFSLNALILIYITRERKKLKLKLN